jgi:hypothetical protein
VRRIRRGIGCCCDLLDSSAAIRLLPGCRPSSSTGRASVVACLSRKLRDALAESGEVKQFLQHTVVKLVSGEVMGVVVEIKERRDAMTELEHSPHELRQVLSILAVLVAAQGVLLS